MNSLTTAAAEWNKLLDRREKPPRIRPPPADKLDTREIVLAIAQMKDNSPVGDVMGPKGEGVFRLYCQNLNGIKLDALGGDFAELCYLANEVQSDVLGVTEHNLDNTQYRVTSRMHETRTRILGATQTKLSMASTPITMRQQYKPGGTLMLANGSIMTRMIESGTDEMGRWSYQVFAGKLSRRVTVVTAYQVGGNSSIHSLQGKRTARAQQASLLMQRNETEIDPRKHFCSDLKKFLQGHLSSGDNNEAIVMGDFNEVFGNDTSGITALFTSLNFTDLMYQRHGTRDVATYARGKTRIDFAFATPTAASCIIACGYEPFNFRMFSDHRAFFLDFDSSRLFGSETSKMASANKRDIQSKSPAQVTVYIESLYQMLSDRNVMDRASALSECTTPNHELAESLDRELERRCLSAGKKCRSFRDPSWSVELSTARSKVAILQRALFLRRSHINVADQLINLQAKRGTNFLIPDTVHECTNELAKAKTDVVNISRESVQRRDAENNDRASALQNGTKEDKRTAIRLKHIKKKEELRRMFAKLKYLRENSDRAGINRVEVPADPTDIDYKNCKEWRSVDAPEEMLECLRERNQTHFGQAQGTPFTLPPLSEEIDFTASTISTEMILDGQYSTEDLDETTALLVKHMAKNDVPLQSTTLDEEEFIGKIKSWKESTTTSPSGLHLGHWHALIARHDHSHNKESKECRNLDKKQQDIIALRLTLINYALKWGYSFERWKVVVNVMILKEPGNVKIHRLRVIHLYEADYNLILATKWRAMIHSAEDAGSINEGLYARSNRSAPDPVFIEEMQSEISRASRKSNVKFDNDAKSCYDRIMAAIASILSRKFGMSKSVVFVMANTLKEAKYKLKTEMGVSDMFYQHCEMFPIYGTGQGSGNSPAIWCIMSSVLFDCHETKAHGAIFQSPDKTETIKVFMIGYVDDCTGQVNEFLSDQQPHPNILIDRMQHDAQLWSDLLWASGGALELPKCTYHVVNWQFTAAGAPILQAGAVGQSMYLKSGDRNTTQVIPFRSAYSHHKTLGHYKEPAGNQSKQYQVLIAKSDKAATFLLSSFLDRKEAWTYYFAIYLPSIGYALPNCHFDLSQLENIQRKAMNIIFAKCGYNRNTKRAILYGPAKLGGASFRHLFTEQGVGQVLSFLRHWRNPTSQPGKLLRIAVAWAQYAIGTGISFLRDVSTALPHMEVRWLRSLRTFLRMTQSRLEVDSDGVSPIQRQHDCYLMDVIVASCRFTPKQICSLNYCRMYLQALTLSDITMAAGTHLDRATLTGDRSLLSSSTKMHHFKQSKPPPAAWKTWRKACSLWSRSDGTLYQPLGQWLASPQALRNNWPAYQGVDQSLYVLEDDKIIRYLHGTQEPSAVRCIPSTASPAQISPGSHTRPWKVDRRVSSLYQTPHGPAPGTFHDFLNQLETWESTLFHTLECLTDPFTMVAQISTVGFKAASDGSVRYDTDGAFGWVLSLPNKVRLATCSGPAFGSNISSYRAEGYGMLSFLRFILRLFQYCDATFHQNPNGELGGILACDNLSLVRNIQYLQNPQRPVMEEEDGFVTDPSSEIRSTKTNVSIASDWDIINEINLTLRDLQFPIFVEWIKGHQDNKKPYRDLCLLAQLNVDADKAAGQFQDQYGEHRPVVHRFSNTTAHLLMMNETVTHAYKSRLRDGASEKPLRDYIQQRNVWSDQTMSCIDWKAHGRALNRNSEKRCNTVKLIHDILPTNASIAKYHPGDREKKCPCCDVHSEDRDHIIRCPSRHTWRTKFLINIRKTCDRQDSKPNLQQLLLDGLSAWMTNVSLRADAYPNQYQKLIRQQNAIGWRQLFNGRMSSEWTRLQEDYLFSKGLLGKTRSGTLWTTAIISAIWKEWDVLWKTRNDDVHGRDATSRARIERESTHKKIRSLYDLKGLMQPNDRHIFFDHVEEHLTQPTSHLQDWYSIQQPTVAHSVKEAKRKSVQNVRRLHTYFPPIVGG